MSLRIKLMLALLLTGLAAVAVVGGLTYSSVNRKFDTIRSKQAAEHFHTYMTAYLTEYGDWKTAIATESFDRFVQRTERRQGQQDGERPSELLERMPPNIDRQSHGRPGPGMDGGPGADGAAAGRPPGGAYGRPQPPAPRADGYLPPRPPREDGARQPGDGQRPQFDERRGPPDGRRPEFDDRRGPQDGRQQPPAARSTQADEPQVVPRVWRATARQPSPASDAPQQAAVQQQADPQQQSAAQPPSAPQPLAAPRAAERDDRFEPQRPEDLRPRGPGPEGDRGRGGPDRPRQAPPFRFVLTDPDYRILLGAGQYARDSILPADARAKARPIEVNGKVAAYVSPEGVVTPTRQELEFLAAMRSSLAAGAGGAAVLALGLGLALSRGLSSRLSHLTSAVRAMHGGSLRQQVPVKGKDEVATLASAFNEMSEQLARSHEELQASHQTILQQADQLRELSIRDALTNLYNRRHFDEQANTLYNQAVRHKRPLSLVIGDIDFFKKINDNYSHATGDAVLRQVGAILRQHVRLSDLVARYGGEEFVLALPETDLPQAAALCDKLRQIIEQHPWEEVQPGLKVTMSMGVFADYAVGTAEAMLQKADALLYQAKESGRNRVCHA